jgi:hypothetical protein
LYSINCVYDVFFSGVEQAAEERVSHQKNFIAELTRQLADKERQLLQLRTQLQAAKDREQGQGNSQTQGQRHQEQGRGGIGGVGDGGVGDIQERELIEVELMKKKQELANLNKQLDAARRNGAKNFPVRMEGGEGEEYAERGMSEDFSLDKETLSLPEKHRKHVDTSMTERSEARRGSRERAGTSTENSRKTVTRTSNRPLSAQQNLNPQLSDISLLDNAFSDRSSVTSDFSDVTVPQHVVSSERTSRKLRHNHRHRRREDVMSSKDPSVPHDAKASRRLHHSSLPHLNHPSPPQQLQYNDHPQRLYRGRETLSSEDLSPTHGVRSGRNTYNSSSQKSQRPPQHMFHSPSPAPKQQQQQLHQKVFQKRQGSVVTDRVRKQKLRAEQQQLVEQMKELLAQAATGTMVCVCV